MQRKRQRNQRLIDRIRVLIPEFFNSLRGAGVRPLKTVTDRLRRRRPVTTSELRCTSPRRITDLATVAVPSLSTRRFAEETKNSEVEDEVTLC